MSYSMDIVMFIGEVRKHEELWNNNHEDSRSPLRRLQAWTAVAKAFIEDFDELSDLEKSDIYKRLQSKWRNLRDSFVRHRRKHNGLRSYIYQKQLTFLEEAYGHNKSSGNDETQIDSEDAWSNEVDDETNLKKMLFKCEDKEETVYVWPKEPSEKRRKIEHETEFVEASYAEPTCSHANDDEDKAFFISLIPSIREFDVDTKLEFRTDLIKLIKKYRSQRCE